MFYHFNKFKYKVKLTVLKKTNTFQLKASLWYSLIFIDFRSSSSCLATWYKAKDQCLACLIRLTLAENIKRSAIQLVCAVLDTKKTDAWRGSIYFTVIPWSGFGFIPYCKTWAAAPKIYKYKWIPKQSFQLECVGLLENS